MSGAQTSTFPDQNILFNSLSGITGQQIQRNELLNTRSRQEIGGTQIEHVSRAAAAVDALPLEQQPAAWQAGGEALVKAGIIPSFQPYPGPERVKQLAGMGMSVENQFKLRGAQNTPDIYGVGGTQPGPSGSTTGAVPALPIPARGTGGPGASTAMPPEYMDHFRRASAETGIPVDLLIAQARQESSFNPNARGAAGEIGIFQIKPSTAQQPGFGLTGVDPGTLTDPGANIMFGARYLKARMGQGDPNNPADQARALAAYNGGGDPNYVANVNRYRPGMSPTDPGAAVTTYTPGGAPATPGTPAPVQVASIPPRVATDATVAPPGAVAPVAAPGTPATPPAAPGTPPAAPAATPAAPAAMPPELQTDATRLTPQDKRELAPILARVRAGQVPYETYQNEVQQRQAANVARQDKWQTQQTAAQQHAQTQANQAATAARADAELELKRLDAAKGKSDADRIKQTLLTIGPKIKAGTASEPEIAQYAYDWNEYAYGDVKVIQNPDGSGGTVTARIPREVRQDLFPPPPGQTGALKPQIVSGTEKRADPAPAAPMTAMLDIGAGNRSIVKALDALEKYPAGVGLMRGSQPNIMSNWTDPEGVKVRAAIGIVQGHIYHDLAGTAQSAGESSRLRSFVPGAIDDAEAAKTKLRGMLESNRETLLDHYRAFGPEAGFLRQRGIEEEILSSIPQTAVDHLKENPKLAKEFDKQFGRGAAKVALQDG